MPTGSPPALSSSTPSTIIPPSQTTANGQEEKGNADPMDSMAFLVNIFGDDQTGKISSKIEAEGSEFKTRIPTDIGPTYSATEINSTTDQPITLVDVGMGILTVIVLWEVTYG
jgi:hypothetical protein